MKISIPLILHFSNYVSLSRYSFLLAYISAYPNRDENGKTLEDHRLLHLLRSFTSTLLPKIDRRPSLQHFSSTPIFNPLTSTLDCQTPEKPSLKTDLAVNSLLPTGNWRKKEFSGSQRTQIYRRCAVVTTARQRYVLGGRIESVRIDRLWDLARNNDSCYRIKEDAGRECSAYNLTSVDSIRPDGLRSDRLLPEVVREKLRRLW